MKALVQPGALGYHFSLLRPEMFAGYVPTRGIHLEMLVVQEFFEAEQVPLGPRDLVPADRWCKLVCKGTALYFKIDDEYVVYYDD